MTFVPRIGLATLTTVGLSVGWAAATVMPLRAEVLNVDELPQAARSIEFVSPGTSGGPNGIDVLDFNGDGAKDIVISDHRWTPPGDFCNTKAGRVLVHYGPFPSLSRLLFTGTASTMCPVGGQCFATTHVSCGEGRNIGDFNGDGLDDLVIVSFRGVFILYGRPSAPTGDYTVGISTIGNGFESFPEYTFIDVRVGNLCGISDENYFRVLPLGDIDGDARSDFYLFPGADLAGAGVYLVFGADGLPGVIEFANAAAGGLRITAMKGGQYVPGVFGAFDFNAFYLPCRGVGDFDRDGFGDFLVVSGRIEAWRAFLVYGGSGFPAEFLLEDEEGLPGRILVLDRFSSRGGHIEVSPPGDLDGDGRIDVSVGFPGLQSGFVLWGQPIGRLTGRLDVQDPLSCEQLLLLPAGSGSILSYGDFTGDGAADSIANYSELRLTASGQPPDKCDLGVRSGTRLELRWLGNNSLTPPIAPHFGTDVDGDGFDDVFVWRNENAGLLVHGAPCLGYQISVETVVTYPDRDVELNVHAVAGMPVSGLQFVVETPATMTFLPPADPLEILNGTILKTQAKRVHISSTGGSVSVGILSDFDPFTGETFSVCPEGVIARLRYRAGAFANRTDQPIRLLAEAGPGGSLFSSASGTDVTPGLGSSTLRVVGFFTRGDANADHRVTISDVVFILRWLFLRDDPGTLPMRCHEAADSNDDQLVNLADAAYLLSYMFMQGPPPPAPSPPSCATDPNGYILAHDCFDACP